MRTKQSKEKEETIHCDACWCMHGLLFFSAHNRAKRKKSQAQAFVHQLCAAHETPAATVCVFACNVSLALQLKTWTTTVKTFRIFREKVGLDETRKRTSLQQHAFFFLFFLRQLQYHSVYFSTMRCKHWLWKSSLNPLIPSNALSLLLRPFNFCHLLSSCFLDGKLGRNLLLLRFVFQAGNNNGLKVMAGTPLLQHQAPVACPVITAPFWMWHKSGLPRCPIYLPRRGPARIQPGDGRDQLILILPS